MIVYRHRKHFLGVVLTDHIIIEDPVDLFRFQQVNVGVIILILAVASHFLFNNLRADPDTLVTDKNTVGTCDQFADLILGFIAERASDFSFSHFVCHENSTFPFCFKYDARQKFP